ncbi:UDP-glucose 4-epimerase GalE [Catellatospora citrea]|uniref:UDP-glucose 4-epimerase n=1 Tax=Catellatospora citrea TaxID=53366 RepID=A0A8J3KC61_9ACTN|nr:UDP-glucose 4-epimerase GalE [Catellatospora citrea]RKE09349.1 UDP-galactose 4-epimerase [Catellatospora citrea]GIF97306.1 UDP-glucose 4-epimerase GalE [Catellatospora citrea]
MKLLVTGGAGYVGSAVARLLVDAGHEVVVLDDLSRNDASQVPAGARLVQARIHDAATVLTPDAGFDAVLHFAGLIAAGESMVRPELHWDNNTVGSLALLDAMRAAGVKRLVFSSTAATYGDPSELPLTETAITKPVNTYGATKLAVDMAIASEAHAHDLAAVSLRYFNVAGALVLPDGSMIGERHDPETHLIPIALQVAAGQREKLAIFGDDYPTPDGTCIRDYIHVGDLAQAHLLALEAARPGEHRIYNLGNGTGFSCKEVVDAVREVTGHPLPVEMAPRRPGDPAELVASSAKARAELGWTPAKPDLRDIVADAWTFFRSGL